MKHLYEHLICELRSSKKKTKIVVRNKEELQEEIKMAIKNNGNTVDLNYIDVSNIDDMSELFKESNFNGDISGWDVSCVKNMSNMFEQSEFYGDISKWKISNENNTSGMFYRCDIPEKNKPKLK